MGYWDIHPSPQVSHPHLHHGFPYGFHPPRFGAIKSSLEVGANFEMYLDGELCVALQSLHMICDQLIIIIIIIMYLQKLIEQ